MKKVSLCIFVSILLIFNFGCESKKNNNASNKNEEDDIELPIKIKSSVDSIILSLDTKCNINGVPVEFEKPKISYNDDHNYVVAYYMKKGNNLDENKVLYFIYNKSGYIQKFFITFKDRKEDFQQFMKIIEYLLQVNDLNIPVDEVNNVYSNFNNKMGTYWKKIIGGRTYLWMLSESESGNLVTFSVDYNY